MTGCVSEAKAGSALITRSRERGNLATQTDPTSLPRAAVVSCFVLATYGTHLSRETPVNPRFMSPGGSFVLVLAKPKDGILAEVPLPLPPGWRRTRSAFDRLASL
jgi:hypothetical protein